MFLRTTFPRRVWFDTGIMRDGKTTWASREPTKEDRQERVELAVSLGMDRTLAMAMQALTGEALDAKLPNSRANIKVKRVLAKLSPAERDRLLQELSELTTSSAFKI